MSLRLERVSKRFGDTVAVQDVSLTLRPGETVALLGPSGCGKSTLLRLIAGLEHPDGGRIGFAGADLTRVSAPRRGFGMVFQDYALFPHLNVFGNVAYGLVERGWRRERQRARVAELLDLVGLAGLEARRVTELSGGQQQRVALARALAPEPRLLLLDEPLSNLDLTLREELKESLRALLASLAIPAVFVTHDQSEAFTVANRVAVMRQGRLLQLGDAETLYARPASVWVARFLGHANLYATSEHRAALARLMGAPPAAPYVLLRSDLVRLGAGACAATVRAHRRVGALHHLELELLGLRVRWRGFARELPPLDLGQPVRLEVPPEALVPLEAG
ncbi:ABC transporter ATP-binding protein [Truepera radiovictrix]|uniref:ABC transporter related protein n=1 Tax=Truepera radiovictrix (strain DSM 17093 / CIP 108686 / LMG 22925 / RQ-24) TaxID=649638 RepID=D7CUD5_TRURR|nr:ABC transporter ATP-binding protein [Truepera radiovictrix]ADI15720.1 ABC transporter related protein [Truepera radiovictrix DSM 17093]WMT58654.1 ABC transporter ATP-binding protein [Truepera radiovictrix]